MGGRCSGCRAGAATGDDCGVRAILRWLPLETPIGTIMYLDASNCRVNGLKGASYVSQSDSYLFRAGEGAVGRCYSNKQNVIVKLTKDTRFDDFHRVGPALSNNIYNVSLMYLDEAVYEYVNVLEPIYDEADEVDLRPNEVYYKILESIIRRKGESKCARV